MESQPVQESNGIVPLDNSIGQDHITVGVFLQTVGQSKEIIIGFDFFDYSPRAANTLHLEPQTRGRAPLQIAISVDGGGTGECNTKSVNLLYQVLVVRIHSVQLVHQVVLFLVGSRVTQGKKRMVKKYVEHWEKMEREAFGLLLWGSVGTGKTTWPPALPTPCCWSGGCRCTSTAGTSGRRMQKAPLQRKTAAGNRMARQNDPVVIFYKDAPVSFHGFRKKREMLKLLRKKIDEVRWL